MASAALLLSQLLIMALMVTICVQFTRGSGWFYEPKRLLGRAVLAWDRPIPIVFHWVLAAFVITVGSWHRR